MGIAEVQHMHSNIIIVFRLTVIDRKLLYNQFAYIEERSNEPLHMKLLKSFPSSPAFDDNRR